VHDSAKTLVKMWHNPAAILEAAVGILLRPARRLHDPVKGNKCKDDDFSHGYSQLLVLLCSFRKAA
jgi:hypothetical protein